MAVIDNVEFPFLNLTLRRDLDVLFCRWHTFVTAPQFHEGYWAALRLAKKHHARFWLHDLRLRNNSTEAEREWYDREFVPALKQQLPYGLTIAYLMSPMQRQHIVSETTPVSEVINYEGVLQVRYFENEHDALEWLHACRIRTIPLH
ncbi:hypothetical protein [Pontibacter rugosus]|uniref:STAS/SEC14 domain-containing protein n=1 Tax=Pontibacter rugosus TaxID=1745966 RepID=A0ABW3SNU0_9BACT